MSLKLYLFILDSLGSTELLFILVIALVFFGPRKLPQLSRSLGKGMAEFRKASEDFKRTWEREVAMETAQLEDGSDRAAPAENSSILKPDTSDEPFHEPSIEAVPAEHVIARPLTSPTNPGAISTESIKATDPGPSHPPRKHDWL